MMNIFSLENYFIKNEKKLLLVFCLVALLRILIFSAAFPFFNNIDEEQHFDTVLKYSHGYLPCKNCNHFEKESIEIIGWYGSPEYFLTDGTRNVPPPLWRLPGEDSARIMTMKRAAWHDRRNHEAYSPPLYYAIAGVWYNVGKLLGFSGGYLLYWLRFLNAVFYALLMGVAYKYCQAFYPRRPFLRLSVPLLLAFFPQDVFYSINNDVLSPLLVVLSLYFLLKIHFDGAGRLFHAFTGLSVAGAVLTKLSNLPLLAVALVIGSVTMRQRTGRLGAQIRCQLIFLATTLAPLALWFCRNYVTLGDITGTVEKISSLGWSNNSILHIPAHPIFSYFGGSYFFVELTRTFWRGEFIWHMQRIASSAADNVYVVTSLAFFGAAIAYTRFEPDAKTRLVNIINGGMVVLFALFLAALSVRYDFGTCFYPSRAYPYFTSGRLISGILIPFLVTYLGGMEYLFSWFRSRFGLYLALLILILVMTASEIATSREVFASGYNFFHLR